MGIRVYIGQRPENIGNAHVVVVSSAVPDSNEEVLAAREHLIPVIPRAEMLAEIARLKYSVLVAGAHGKTTATSLIAAIFGYGGLDPTIVIGGKLKATGRNAKLGKGEFIVAEADESDGSFLALSPTLAVVTNIDREHMEYFLTMERLKEGFLSFINKVPFYGVSFVYGDDERLKELIPHIHRRYITYGLSESCDIYAKNIEKGFMNTTFEVICKGNELGRFSIPLPGKHNVLNCLASIGVSLELKIELLKIKEAIRSFNGIQRRFEFKGEEKGIRIYDDYGHHPTEIRATLSAARDNLKYIDKNSRLFVIFQPHRYTRTAELMDEFASSFSDADVLFLSDIYPAGEKPIEGITSEALFEKIIEKGQCDAFYLSGREDILDKVGALVRKGDIILTLGAGDVWQLGERLLQRLKKK
jgi:UDP-N-acetylmuramate--alanine ligase